MSTKKTGRQGNNVLFNLNLTEGYLRRQPQLKGSRLACQIDYPTNNEDAASRRTSTICARLPGRVVRSEGEGCEHAMTIGITNSGKQTQQSFHPSPSAFLGARLHQ